MPDSIDVMQQMAQSMSDSMEGQVPGQQPQALPPDIAQSMATGQQPDQQQAQPVQQPAAQPPKMGGLPNIVQLIGGMINPNSPRFNPTATPGRPASRADVFENFIGNFLGSMASGLSQAGKGPGANLRGFAGAVTAPHERDVQQFQMQQEAAKQQAQTQALTAQPRFDPDSGKYLGTMNDAQYQQYVKGVGAAKIKSMSDVDKAKIAARAKIDAAGLQAQVRMGQLARMVPGVNPVSGKPEYEMFNRAGESMGFAENSVVTSLLAKTSNTVQYMQDGDGNLHVLPKSTTTKPVIPGGIPQGSAAPNPQTALAQRVPALAGATGATSPAAAPKPIGGPGSRIVQGFEGKAGKDTGYAYDQNGTQIPVTRGEAARKGLQGFLPVSAAEQDKHRNQLRQLNDVQMNTSRYTLAAKAYDAANLPASVRLNDQKSLDDLLNKAGFADMNVAISQGGKVDLPIISAVSEALSRESKTASYQALSPQAKDLYDNFVGQMSAVPAYQKALTNIGRTNKEMLDLELANIANPSMAPQDILRKQIRFQQNIDRAAEGFPRFQNMDTPKSIRQQIEGSGSVATTRANFANIPNPFNQFKVPDDAPAAPKEDGHKLKANGQVIAVSKGGKWVAPR